MSTFKCKKCGIEFDEKKRLEIHSKVHGRKSKIIEAGGIDFDRVGF
jgi:predicted Zn-ribbon and HTH transcriptional regulator